ncbi:hypothetical protein [Chryseobacterium rhizosphaerae]|jgi:hypothetical protein|uniref:DUF4960 domain-containing protein n=1 Tax=Chryseobacterium rhizosphaerae TaxID=395937 RepID=A0ABX9IKB1_9FLAO|nr:hypothetical protein [Chryseobacterium rhizosphaerae]MDR6546250.1 hypothetical protein [Chryseobacterium rhizosphaerae]REC75439.1 hypothetical protein DRF57_10480 [Chryseobacterium rhizosphaerae]GEN66339.1 hypothetical protein CRH01_09070 [Chryseobacterium rhizosphaerae]
MKKVFILMTSLSASLFFPQVGINTPNPTEILDVNGIERVRELPKHNSINAIFTKPDGTKSESKNQTFTATKMVVADANGVLGYVDWSPTTIPGGLKKRVTIGYWAGLWDGNLYAIGGTGFPIFNSQLQSRLNYGPNGIYNKVEGIDFQQFETEQLNIYTGAQLKNFVDVFCIGVKNGEDLDATIIAKIKDFANLGGVVMVLLDAGRNTPALQGFGGTGTVSSGGINAFPIAGSTGTTGVFGTISNTATIIGAQTMGRVLNTQLAPGSELLAREGGSVAAPSLTQAGIWMTGPGGRVMFLWDEGVFRNSSISGTFIDTEQEKYLHNLMASLLDKLNL